MDHTYIITAPKLAEKTKQTSENTKLYKVKI